MLHRRSNLAAAAALQRLPGLGAQLEADGMPVVRGTVVDVADGRMVVDVRSPSKAALLAAAASARLTVDGPADCRFVTTANITTTDGARINLRVSSSTQVVRRTA